jgi:hypothetical protein
VKTFYTATTPDGRLLEYRSHPLFTLIKHVHRWMHMPVFVRRWVRAHAVQSRIDGGRWQTIGGYDDRNRVILLGGGR